MGVELLEPLKLGSLQARNRITFGPHETNLGWGRAISDRHVAYYRRRAEGGAGTIIVEEAAVHPFDWPYERSPLATECDAGWSAIASSCHVAGALVVAAIGHSGGQGTSHWSQRELWAPSHVPEVNTREVPKSMEEADIEAVISGFGDAARRAVRAGCDGVEINAGQYSLVRQFLSGLTNQRVDAWGANRTLFARRVIDEVRRSVGDAIVLLRLSCEELAPWAGITPDMAIGVAEALSSGVDAITVVRGSIYSTAATRPDTHTPPGFNLDLAASIRAAVAVPVIAQGSIVDWGQAEWAVGEGDRVDGVEMTRALIADAELVSKLERGDGDRIRPCILCNQACQVRDNRNPIITCVVDPLSGHEIGDASTDGLALTPVSITVLGGGTAGMEAARVAASRGHQVTLYEQSDRLGGTVAVAATAVGRSRLALFTDWLASELDRLGVDVRLESGGTVQADGAVIVATGSIPGVIEYPVTRTAVRLSAGEVLAGAELPDGTAFVWDPIGGPIGVSVAESLAASGRAVMLATPDNIVGNELSRSGDLAPANARLQQAGVQLLRRTLLRSAKKGVVVLEDRFSGERRTVKVGVLIDAGHRLADHATFDGLVRHDGLVVRIGDAVAPRTIHEAVLEARRAVLAIEGVGELSDGVPMGELTHG